MCPGKYWVCVASHLTREGQHGAGHHLFSRQLGQENLPFPPSYPSLPLHSLIASPRLHTLSLAEERPAYSPLSVPEAFPSQPVANPFSLLLSPRIL